MLPISIEATARSESTNTDSHMPGAKAISLMPPVEAVTIDTALRDRDRNPLFHNRAVADVSKGRLLFALALAAYATIDIWILRWVPVGMDTGDFWHLFYSSYAELFFNND